MIELLTMYVCVFLKNCNNYQGKKVRLSDQLTDGIAIIIIQKWQGIQTEKLKSLCKMNASIYNNITYTYFTEYKSIGNVEQIRFAEKRNGGIDE